MPSAEQAVVDLEKLRTYCLNPGHPRGRHKARVFAATLGLTAEDASELRLALLAPDVFEVEFSDDEGRTYAMAPLRVEQLMLLHHQPVRVA